MASPFFSPLRQVKISFEPLTVFQRSVPEICNEGKNENEIKIKIHF